VVDGTMSGFLGRLAHRFFADRDATTRDTPE